MDTQPQGQQDFKKTYHKLISAYVWLLRLMASGQEFRVTRWVIEDHIRVNLREIAEGLTLFEYYLTDSAPDNDLSWTRGQAEYLTRVAGQLANIREPVIKYVWRGFALLFTGSVLEFAGPNGQAGSPGFILANIVDIIQTLLLTFGAVLMLAALVFATAGMILIHLKRSLLKPGHDEYDQSRGVSSQVEEGLNVYQLENDLFTLLGRKKPKEPAWDVWGLVIVGILMTAPIIGVLLAIRSAWPSPLTGIAIILGLILAAFILLAPEIRSRLRRER